MTRYYTLKNLFIGEMRLVDSEYSYYTGIFFILRKIDDLKISNDEQFQEIFTKNKYKKSSSFIINSDLVVDKTFSILNFCNKKEIIKGKITKKRLIEIYNIINQITSQKQTEEYCKLYENNKIKKLIKNYEDSEDR